MKKLETIRVFPRLKDIGVNLGPRYVEDFE